MKGSDVENIRRRYWLGREKPSALAREYGVSRGTIYNIAQCRTRATQGWEAFYRARKIALEYIKDCAAEIDTYGVCIARSPQLFIPDPEMSVPGMLYAWADAVFDADAGNVVEIPSNGGWSADGSIHILRTPWGYGTNYE